MPKPCVNFTKYKKFLSRPVIIFTVNVRIFCLTRGELPREVVAMASLSTGDVQMSLLNTISFWSLAEIYTSGQEIAIYFVHICNMSN